MAKDKSGVKGANALNKSPSHLLHRALQLALDLYAEEFGLNGLTQRQFAVLAAVSAKEGLTQTELVTITGIDRSTLADMATRMITKGLLERQKSSVDGRANAVSLTDAGRAALEDARPRMAATDARLLKLIPSSKRETFMGLLSDLVASGAAPAVPKAEKAEKPKKTKAEKAAKKKAKKALSLDADIQQ